MPDRGLMMKEKNDETLSSESRFNNLITDAGKQKWKGI